MGLLVAPSPLWDGTVSANELRPLCAMGAVCAHTSPLDTREQMVKRLVIMCDTLRHRGRASGNGLRGDSIVTKSS